MGKPITRPGSTANTDRNFEKKVQFYAKVRDAVSSLNVKKTISKKNKAGRRQKKLKAYNLCTLSEALPAMKIQQQRTPATERKVNFKSRRKLILREGKQFGTVLNHPAFHSNPLAAIHQHLESTQPVANEKLNKKVNKNGSKKKKEKKLKAAEWPRSMEIVNGWKQRVLLPFGWLTGSRSSPLMRPWVDQIWKQIIFKNIGVFGDTPSRLELCFSFRI